MTTTRHVPVHPLARRPAPSTLAQARSFAAIGLMSTLAYAGLYGMLRGVAAAPLANALALTITGLGNTAANRRLTFGVRGRRSLARDHVAGLAALAVALAITTPAAALLGAFAPHTGRPIELAVLLGTNACATVARFVLLRSWIAASRRTVPSSIPLERTTL
jgi:putative flippase GtrA